jgi:2-methylisocitrate lyase-like PEP mutase family enzyme
MSEILARGIAPTAGAWPILVLLKRINSPRGGANIPASSRSLTQRGLASNAARDYSRVKKQSKGVTMPATTADKRITFRKIHETGCFVLPNPYDVGSARALQHLGFKAIASTSAGYAWSIGRADNRVTLEDVLQHLTALCGAVDLPVNADFEGGFAHKPEKVAANVARAVKTGVAGLSIEDSTGDAAKPLYERAFAIERIRAARTAIDADSSGVLLVGRCEGFLVGQADLNMVIDRLQAYAQAGADCLYAPGIKSKEQIAAVVKAVHPKPVNLLIGASGLSVAEAADLGVRRISVGGSLARAAWGGFMRAAREIAEKGSFTELGNGYPGGDLNKMFG